METPAGVNRGSRNTIAEILFSCFTTYELDDSVYYTKELSTCCCGFERLL